MPLPEPVFDSRKYRDILNEAVRRIPVHNPEWNNHSDSDPGITLLQLFAFMTESLLYRANRIPERNRQKFLRLLGLGMRPPHSARGLVTLAVPKSSLETSTLDADREVRAGSIPFRTENGLDVLPAEAGVFYKSRVTGDRFTEAETIYRQLYASFEEAGRSLEFYETKVFEPPSAGSLLPSIDVVADAVDGLWLALFARPNADVQHAREEIANRTLTIGILPALGEEGCVVEPDGVPRTNDRLALSFETPNLAAPPSAAPAYTPIEARTSSNPLLEPSIIELPLGDASSLSYWNDLEPLEAGTGSYPPSLEDDARKDRLITWVRIRLPEHTDGGQVSFRVGWIGINAAKIVQRAHVRSELLPQGTGEPDQVATLANTPVLLDSVRLTVGGEVWERIDDLNAAGSEIPTRGPRLASETVDPGPNCAGLDAGPDVSVAAAAREPLTKVFILDRESGEVRFGDGIHGTRPPAGAVLQVSYDYGGGVEGMVGIGSVKGALPSGVEYVNPVPTWGGDEGETVDAAEKRIPEHLRNRERLVADADFRQIAATTPGVDLGRVEVLSLFHPELPSQTALGVVTVMVIPKTDPRNPLNPTPDRLFLETVCEFLAPRRLLTTELHVRGPAYVDIWVSLAIEVAPGRDQGPVREDVRESVENFLSPLHGGFDGNGWPLEKAVDVGEIVAAAARVSGVAKVSAGLLGDDSGERAAALELTGLELPRLAGLSVVSGSDPTPIDELKGETRSETTATEFTPVPIVPESC